MKVKKIIYVLFLGSICLKLFASQSSSIIVKKGGSFTDLLFINDSMGTISADVSTLNTAIAGLKSGDKITFTASTKKFSDISNANLEIVSGTLGTINGQYGIYYKLDGTTGYQQMLFTDTFTIGLDDFVPGSGGQKLIPKSGEHVVALYIGFEFDNGNALYSSELSSVKNAVNDQLVPASGPGKNVSIKVTYSASSKTATVNVVDSTGASISGFPKENIALQGTAGTTLKSQHVLYQTSNMKKGLLVNGDQMSFIFNDDASLIVHHTPSPSGHSPIYDPSINA